MSFYGTDKAEKQACKEALNRPQLDSGKSVPKQARYLSDFLSKEDDLTFKEYSVKDATEDGRARVVHMFMQALATAYRRERAGRKKAKAAAAAAAASAPQGSAPSMAGLPLAEDTPSTSSTATPTRALSEEVLDELDLLQAVRAKGRMDDLRAVVAPLRRLAAMPIDARILRNTKVALELNHDFWKKAAVVEVRMMVATLVREWKTVYRAEQGGPSERTLRNAAADLEDGAFALAPRSDHYQQLVEALLAQVQKVPDLAGALLEGSQRGLDVVQRAHQRVKLDILNAKRGVKRPAPPRAV